MDYMTEGLTEEQRQKITDIPVVPCRVDGPFFKGVPIKHREMMENMYYGQCLDTSDPDLVFLEGDLLWGTGASIVVYVEMCKGDPSCASAGEIDRWRKSVKVFFTTAGNYVDFDEKVDDPIKMQYETSMANLSDG